MADLVGVAEIAKRLDAASTQTVHSWLRRDPTFPEPVAQFGRTLVWHWPDVRAWARRTGRL